VLLTFPDIESHQMLAVNTVYKRTQVWRIPLDHQCAPLHGEYHLIEEFGQYIVHEPFGRNDVHGEREGRWYTCGGGQIYIVKCLVVGTWYGFFLGPHSRAVPGHHWALGGSSSSEPQPFSSLGIGEKVSSLADSSQWGSGGFAIRTSKSMFMLKFWMPRSCCLLFWDRLIPATLFINFTFIDCYPESQKGWEQKRYNHHNT
jgi:hypothetical protein